MKCKLCHNEIEKNSKLCANCNNNRMLNASCDRIFAGTGLTFSNVEKYSEANFIKAARPTRGKESK